MKVYVTGDALKKDENKEGLKRAKGYLRTQMASEVGMQKTPDLKFIFIQTMVSAGNGTDSSDLEGTRATLPPLEKFRVRNSRAERQQERSDASLGGEIDLLQPSSVELSSV